MHDYQVSAEVVRVTLIVGVLLSMMVYERLQLTTGGAIVPAYLALAASRPPAIVATLLIGWLTYLVVHKLIARKHILYGRRKFEIEVLVGVGLTLVSALIARWAGQLDPMLLALSAIGFLVPGILAHDMARQKPGRTLLTTVATGGLLVVFLTTYESLLDLVPGTGQTGISLSSVHGFPSELLLPAVAGSVLVGMFVFAKLQLRSGGFVTGAYLAYVAP